MTQTRTASIRDNIKEQVFGKTQIHILSFLVIGRLVLIASQQV